MVYTQYFSNAGVPQTGLTPVFITLLNVLTSGSVTPPTILELGGGWYTYSLTPVAPLAGVIDGGVSLANVDRYKNVLIPVSAATAFGSVQATLTLYDPIAATPIPDVEVVIFNSDQSLLVNSALSNSMGMLVAQLNPGTYVVTFRKDGYNFTTPTIITVAALTPFAQTFNGTQVGNVAADFRAIVVPRNLSSPEDA